MHAVNLPLTTWTQRFCDRVGRLITQAYAVATRAFPTAQDFAALQRKARVAFSSLREAIVDFIEREVLERVYTDRMAIRRLFLLDPRDAAKGYTKDGLTLLSKLARNAGALSANLQNDPIALARAEGKRECLALIWTEIFEDLPQFAQIMAAEERRRENELVRT